MHIVQDYSVLYNNAVRGRVCILLTHGKHLHGSDGRFELKQTGITPPLFLKCLYRVKKVSGHVFVC